MNTEKYNNLVLKCLHKIYLCHIINDVLLSINSIMLGIISTNNTLALTLKKISI